MQATLLIRITILAAASLALAVPGHGYPTSLNVVPTELMLTSGTVVDLAR